MMGVKNKRHGTGWYGIVAGLLDTELGLGVGIQGMNDWKKGVEVMDERKIIGGEMRDGTRFFVMTGAITYINHTHLPFS